MLLQGIRDFVGHNKGNNKVAVYACALSGDDKHAISGALDGSVKVWDVSTGKELFSVKEHQNAVMQVKSTICRRACRALATRLPCDALG